MDRLNWKKKLTPLIMKYKYAICILCIGILFMTFPFGETEKEPIPQTREELSVSEELTRILTQIYGVGKVQVMITQAAGAETVYQRDEDRTGNGDSVSVSVETVVISTDQGETGLIRTVSPPTYLGAIIVCQGGGDPAVRLAVTEAVANVTGLGSDRITVLKMK